MGEPNDTEVARELGGIAAHLSNIDSKLSEIVVQTTATNGRLRAAEAKIAVLEDREKGYDAQAARIDALEGRPRTYALAIGGPALAAIIGVITGALTHGF